MQNPQESYEFVQVPAHPEAAGDCSHTQTRSPHLFIAACAYHAGPVHWPSEFQDDCPSLLFVPRLIHRHFLFTSVSRMLRIVVNLPTSYRVV